MEELFGTIINVAFYIFIFKLFLGGSSKKKNPKNAEGNAEKNIEKKKKKNFLEEAMEQLAKLEENSQEQVKKKKRLKRVPQVQENVVELEKENRDKEELAVAVEETEKKLDEKSDEIYYNNGESVYKLTKKDLKKAIVYSEIIGKPVSKRIGMPYRR